jgi:hypothetical protein
MGSFSYENRRPRRSGRLLPSPRSEWAWLAVVVEVKWSSTAVGLVAERIAAAVVPRLAVQKGAYPTQALYDMIKVRAVPAKG